ncbi:Hypothetical protein Nlim_1062 [Candidatus Nitrosarchaeum limnium SFB1]|uniref:Uncharacterized protein n=1 Tax=Candidatus Nitrosarchaeum limnium SFB1 TaxID=886738 RepID=F3KKN8_9ARCH|nr:Hypothetical protein Nlim_1062 [Candidatus Nitrosarchaeum limnium SFB1]
MSSGEIPKAICFFGGMISANALFKLGPNIRNDTASKVKIIVICLFTFFNCSSSYIRLDLKSYFILCDIQD